MKITFETLAHCMVVFENWNGKTYGPNASFENLEDAFEYAKEEIEDRQQALRATIFDSETGEVYLTCEADDDEENYPEDGEPNWDLDMGFDPYEGLYSYDN